MPLSARGQPSPCRPMKMSKSLMILFPATTMTPPHYLLQLDDLTEETQKKGGRRKEECKGREREDGARVANGEMETRGKKRGTDRKGEGKECRNWTWRKRKDRKKKGEEKKAEDWTWRKRKRK